MSNFSCAMDKVLALEGGYVKSKHENGGEAAYGVSKVIARAFGYKGKMSEMPVSVATDIYYKGFWVPMKLNEIKNKELCFEIFELSIHVGQGQAIKIIKTALNNIDERGFEANGVINEQTYTNRLIEVDVYPDAVEELIYYINELQKKHYKKVVKNNKDKQLFLNGWMKRTGGF